MHVVESFVDLCKVAMVGDIFVNLEFTIEVVFYKSGDLGSTFDASECSATPGTASHQLEGSRGNLLPCRRHTNNSRHTPSFMAGLQRSPHDVNVTGTVKGVVQPAIGNIH